MPAVRSGIMAGMQDATTTFPRPLLILKTGDTFDTLRSARGDFEHWIAEGLGKATPVLVLDPRGGDAIRPTPQAASLLRSFARIVAQRAAAPAAN